MFLIIDIGSTFTKLIVFTNDLRVNEVRSLATPYVSYGEINRCIDPKKFWSELAQGISLLELDQRTTELWISITGMGSSIIPLDNTGAPLYPAITWLSSFPIPKEDIRMMNVATTGKYPMMLYPLYKIGYLQERLGRVNKWVSLPDLILSKLIEQKKFYTDFSFASRSMLFNDAECRWDSDLLRNLSMKEQNVPIIVEAGTVIGSVPSSVRKFLRLPSKAHVAVGMHDHVATLYLANFIFNGESLIVDSTGTSEAVEILVLKTDNQLVFKAPQYLLNTESTWDKEYIALVGYPCPSGLMMKFASNYGFKWDEFLCEPLPRAFFIPFKRRLLNNDGKLILENCNNLSFSELLRTMIFGTQFELNTVIKDLENLLFSTTKNLVIFGGQASNEVLCQLKAYVTGFTVQSYPHVYSAAALGTALRTLKVNDAIDNFKLLKLRTNLIEKAKSFMPEEGNISNVINKMAEKYFKFVKEVKT